jgi:hypothetical protein
MLLPAGSEEQIDAGFVGLLGANSDHATMTARNIQ